MNAGIPFLFLRDYDDDPADRPRHPRSWPDLSGSRRDRRPGPVRHVPVDLYLKERSASPQAHAD